MVGSLKTDVGFKLEGNAEYMVLLLGKCYEYD